METMEKEGHEPGALAEALIAAYAAGSLDEARSLLVATHLALSPAGRRALADYEALGGALLEELEPAPLSEDALDSVLARLDEAAAPESRAASAPESPRDIDLRVPRPLRDYLGGGFDKARWHRLLPGVAEAAVGLEDGPERVRLLKVAAGKAVPKHGHRGEELTLVLTGAYRDASGLYVRGDLQVCDESLDHRPVAEAGEDCICLVVTEAPLRLTGPIGRLFDRFISYR